MGPRRCRRSARRLRPGRPRRGQTSGVRRSRGDRGRGCHGDRRQQPSARGLAPRHDGDAVRAPPPWLGSSGPRTNAGQLDEGPAARLSQRREQVGSTPGPASYVTAELDDLPHQHQRRGSWTARLSGSRPASDGARRAVNHAMTRVMGERGRRGRGSVVQRPGTPSSCIR